MAEAKRSTAVYWVGAAILAVIAIVIAVKVFGRDREDAFDDIDDIEVDTVSDAPERLRVRVLARHAHADDAFTQGLLWHEGHLYESTGLRRRSSLRKVDLASGRVLARRDLEPQIFAEGLARVGSRLFQLTWEDGIAYVWNLEDFEPVRTFRYEGEGWGLCYDGEHLVMSDGSDALTFRDPESFRAVRTVHVKLEGEPVDQLNELECVDGVLWANIWQTDEIVRIDPASGDVTGVVDARGLLSDRESAGADVLNGIAWIPERRRFAITGKLWPALFEVEFVPEEP
jgi:glutaminyl-peptide cyclotransferase